MRKHLFTVLTLVAVTGCGGGGGATSALPSLAPVTQTPQVPPAPSTNSLVSAVFTLTFPAETMLGTKRMPRYVPQGTQSATIVLTSVNGAPPASGLKTSATTNVTAAGCAKGCAVAAPAAPPGQDTFTFTVYSAQNGAGAALATSTQTFTLVAGSSNPGGKVTLNGIPATISISGIPSATIGTKASAALTVSAQDAAGQTITGTYANPITLSDSDSSGALGTSISVNGGAAGGSATIVASSDTVNFTYGGGPVSNVVLSANASGAAGANAPFQVTANPILYSGPLVNTNPEVDLYAASGTGSNGAVSFTEAGYAGPGLSGTFTATASGCGSIATVSPSVGTSFTISAVSSPSAGTCSINFTDAFGQTKSVAVTYTTWSFGGFQ